jgi:uncharacterized membrane protein YfcA
MYILLVRWQQVTRDSPAVLGRGQLRTALLLVLALVGSWFVLALVAGLRRIARTDPERRRRYLPSAAEAATGFGTVFFDTFGIGSFATTTAVFRAWRLVPDELIPGTLNVGHTVTSVLGAFIFIQLVPVAPGTLLSMIAAAGLGAWLGAGIVTRLPRHRVRLGMGAALVVAASIMLLTQLGLLPGGADALGLYGLPLAAAVAANFVLGGLMTLGIGLYAPCMIVVSLLGMNPRAAFPIMMGSCAFLMSISGARFIRAGRYHPSAAVGLTLGGIPALFIAAFLVRSLPLAAVRWVVIVIVLYTALTLLHAGRRELASLRGAAPSLRPTG